MSPPISSAREAALQALLRADRHNGYVQDELHVLLAAGELSPADRGLATEIALGVVRHRRTCDRVLKVLLRQPIERMDPAARRVLECAAYQVLFLDRVPDYAVVNESVELVRRHCPRKLTGLVNAVGRKLVGLVDREVRPEDVDDPRRVLPCPRGGAVVVRRPVLGAEAASRLADGYSFPPWLAQRWVRRWGERKAEGVMAALDRPPRVFARVNGLRATPDDVLDRLPEALREGVRTPRPEMLDLTAVPHDTQLALLRDGLVVIEDPTTLLPVEAMELSPGQTVLDLCAAPGGKTTVIAERLAGRGELWALDREGDRLRMLRETVARLDLPGVRVAANRPGERPAGMPEEFDRVLVDVPCSNTGVLNRRAEARWRVSREALADLAVRQRELLAQGAAATRVGGVCVYSTCSLESEENGERVRAFTADHPSMVLQVERETLPSDAGDGGYFARLVRIEPA